MRRSIYLSPILLAALAAGLMPATGAAITVGCVGSGCDYHYNITLTGLSGGVEDTAISWNFVFDWVGPFKINAAANSFISWNVTGAPKNTMSWTGGDFTDNGTDPVINLTFSDGGANGVTYTLTEPDAFWAVRDTQSFDSGAVTYSITGTDPTTCGTSGCSVTTTSSVLTPEPGSLMLLGLGLAAFVLYRSRHRTSTIHV